MEYKILIVEDHPLTREGLSMCLSREPDIEVVGQASDYDGAIQLIESSPPHLVIAEVALHKGSGINFIKQLRATNPSIKIIVLSAHDESLYGERAVCAGAVGYISKRQSSADVINAIRTIVNGGRYLSPALQQCGENGDSMNSPLCTLSDREIQVLALIGQGLSTRDVAERLELSIHTIETYREKIKTKLHLKNAAELWHFAVQTALQHDESNGELSVS